MAVIDDYFVFGTSNLWNYPNRVADCLAANDSRLIENANPYDPCGNDRSDLDLYRCLEDGVYANSIVVLDKHTFDKRLVLPTQGVGTFQGGCWKTATYLGLYPIVFPDEPEMSNIRWYDNDFCGMITT